MATKQQKQEKELEGAIRSIRQSRIVNHGSLSRELKISPKACITVNEAGMGVTFHTPTVEILIGVGNDHTGHLIMDEDCFKAFKNGEEVHIETLRSFKKKFL